MDVTPSSTMTFLIVDACENHGAVVDVNESKSPLPVIERVPDAASMEYSRSPIDVLGILVGEKKTESKKRMSIMRIQVSLVK